MMKAVYKGYCVKKIGNVMEQMPPVKLRNEEESINYVMLHRQVFDEVFIEDSEEYVILHAVNGKIVFPKEFAGR